VTPDALDTPEAGTLSIEDLERAYEQALQAMEAVEGAVEIFSESVADEMSQVDGPAAEAHSRRRPTEGESGPDEAAAGVAPAEAAPALQPLEVIEAALFVGGGALTTRRLGQLLGSSDSAERIVSDIDTLNAAYREQARPYHIVFGEGGYRLELLPEFEPIRHSVFGIGPKEVKLSQDALEVLAFVAYRQPATAGDLEDAGKEKAPALLRQLLRRELVALSRSDDGLVSYRTTRRFLDLFGLRSLDDLPFPEDFELK
jgi:segregation and condensation protein B